MKVTLNWLKQYVDFDSSPDELAERLTMIGIEVEHIQKLSGDFEGVVVAQILDSTPHPNADRLSVCRVTDGQGERQIVCGAKNYKVGDKVPLILPGHSLPVAPGAPPFTIKVSKMRGVESQGMLCSPNELGLAKESDGLLILPAEAKVGQSFAEHLGRAAGDAVFDLEITPNRPDWNSVLGIAREVAAVTSKPLRIPQLVSPPSRSENQTAESFVKVRLEDAGLCPRYIARVIRGVKVGPSPDWLRQTLEKVGVRSISNVVDVTNFVMLESGQPLHAFDYHLLTAHPGQAPTIVVRRAREGETFTTLDRQLRKLRSDMLLIADEQNPIALAGIMGGQNSEINEQTVDVLLESAHFKPQNIRATSKQLELRTESSYRFERGGDADICEWASARATQLILETAGGNAAVGSVDVYPQPKPPGKIPLRFKRTQEVLGIDVPPAAQLDYLRRLEFGTDNNPGADSAVIAVPSFRVDVKQEIDLIEEIARLYGVDRIPATPPRGAIGHHPFDSVHDRLMEAKRILTGLGFHESQGQTLISEESVRLLTPAEQAEAPPLVNPLSADMNLLRPSLLPGLLAVLQHNASRRNHDASVFEIGRIFARHGDEIREQWSLALAMTGHREASFWTGAERETVFDIYDLKGVLEEFLDQFGVRSLTYERRDDTAGLFVESATAHLGKQDLGELGQLLPTVGKRLDFRAPVYLAELNLDLALARRSPSKSFKPLPSFPSVRRDVALLVPEGTTHDMVLAIVKQAKPDHLEGVELFDVFRGQNVPAGRKSVAYAFTYRHGERTLTDTEVNAAHEKLLQRLRQLPEAVIRD